MATFYTKHEYFGSKRFQITPGQLVTSLSRLHTHTGYTVQRLRTALKHLSESNLINMETTNKATIITICQWDSYQSMSGDSNKQTVLHPTRQGACTEQSDNAISLLDNSLHVSKREDPENMRTKRESSPLQRQTITSCAQNAAQEEPEPSVDPQDLQEALSVLEEVGNQFHQAIDSETWKKYWMKELPRILGDISRNCTKPDQTICGMFRKVLVLFFGDKIRIEKKTNKYRYFASDWPEYWPVALKQHTQEKQQVLQKRVDQIQRELSRKQPDRSPHDFRGEAVQLAIAEASGLSDNAHQHGSAEEKRTS